MTLDEFRQELASYRLSADDEARSFKDSYIALDRLYSLYRKFDDVERRMADQVFSEWALSENEGLRFDALALIGHFRIKASVASLGELAARLSSSTKPGAPFELEKILRILTEIGT